MQYGTSCPVGLGPGFMNEKLCLLLLRGVREIDNVHVMKTTTLG